MPQHQVIGLVLILIGATDVLVGALFVAPRVTDRMRPLVLGAIGLGALTCVVLGALFYSGMIGG